MNILHILIGIAVVIILGSSALFMFCACQIAGQFDSQLTDDEEEFTNDDIAL